MLGAVLAKAARLGPAADRAPDEPNQSAGRLPRTSDEGIQCSSPNASGLGSAKRRRCCTASSTRVRQFSADGKWIAYVFGRVRLASGLRAVVSHTDRKVASLLGGRKPAAL